MIRQTSPEGTSKGIRTFRKWLNRVEVYGTALARSNVKFIECGHRGTTRQA